jgi:hypothetical protein
VPRPWFITLEMNAESSKAMFKVMIIDLERL